MLHLRVPRRQFHWLRVVFAATISLAPLVPISPVAGQRVIPLADTIENLGRRQRVGLVVGGLDHSGTADSLGTKIVRYSLYWGFTLRYNNMYNFANHMAAYRNKGVIVLANPQQRWMNTDTIAGRDTVLNVLGSQYSCLPANIPASCVPKDSTAAWDSFIADWESFMIAAIGADSAGAALFWSPWNEPNTSTISHGFWAGTDHQYDKLSAVTCRIAHRYGRYCVGPEAAISVNHDSTDFPQGGRPWLRARIAAADAGDSTYYDAISVHSHGRSDLIRPTLDSIALYDAPLRDRCGLWECVGRSRARVWNTETASPGYAADLEMMEKDLYLKSAPILAMTSPVQLMFQYQVQTDAAGLIDFSGHRRPAWYALSRLMHDSSYTMPAQGYCTANLSGATSTSACTNYAITDTSYHRWSYVDVVGISRVFLTPQNQPVNYSAFVTHGLPLSRFEWYVDGILQHTGYGNSNDFDWSNSGVPFNLEVVVTDVFMYQASFSAYVEPYNPCYPYDCASTELAMTGGIAGRLRGTAAPERRVAMQLERRQSERGWR